MGLNAKNRIDTQITKHLNAAIDLLITQSATDSLKLDRERIRTQLTEAGWLESGKAVIPLEDVLSIVDNEIGYDSIQPKM